MFGHYIMCSQMFSKVILQVMVQLCVLYLLCVMPDLIVLSHENVKNHDFLVLFATRICNDLKMGPQHLECMLHMLFTRFICINKVRFFFILVDHKWDIIPCTLQDIKNKRTIIKHIQIIIPTRKTKICMPKPQTLVCNYFKDNVIVLIFVTKSILPMEWATFSNIVHAI